MTHRLLSDHLRETTAPEHRTAERTLWARKLAAGDVPRPVYATYLDALHIVYSALEESVSAAVDAGQHPLVAAVHDTRLDRSDALKGDAIAWAPAARTPTAGAALRAARDYADRIRWAAGHDPALLVSHHYVRYLGDLSGGQIVAAALRRTHGGDGLAFYDFSVLHAPSARGGVSLVPAVRAYRSALDAVTLDEGTASRVVQEAQASFGHTTAVFTAMEPLLSTS